MLFSQKEQLLPQKKRHLALRDAAAVYTNHSFIALQSNLIINLNQMRMKKIFNLLCFVSYIMS